ncbi:hypothetical protein KM043_009398 [Ampulex compressa]|nr:hypothetical protein KM043_009398 [Ampulex compressa]
MPCAASSLRFRPTYPNMASYGTKFSRRSFVRAANEPSRSQNPGIVRNPKDPHSTWEFHSMLRYETSKKSLEGTWKTTALVRGCLVENNARGLVVHSVTSGKDDPLRR